MKWTSRPVKRCYDSPGQPRVTFHCSPSALTIVLVTQCKRYNTNSQIWAGLLDALMLRCSEYDKTDTVSTFQSNQVKVSQCLRVSVHSQFLTCIFVTNNIMYSWGSTGSLCFTSVGFLPLWSQLQIESGAWQVLIMLNHLVSKFFRLN